MAQHVRVGTHIDPHGTTLDVYVVERIVKREGTLSLEVRTKRQRCFDRTLTGYTTWTEAFLREQVRTGQLTILASYNTEIGDVT